MESSTVVGFMGVFAVSASVVLLARQAHAYLLSDFMKKLELELGGGVKARSKKTKTRTRFADDVTVLSLNNKEYEEQHSTNLMSEDNVNMRLNRVALYKGIMEYKAYNGYFDDRFRKRVGIHGIGRPRFQLLIPKTHHCNRP